jgi:hypothetical protein
MLKFFERLFSFFRRTPKPAPTPTAFIEPAEVTYQTR